MGSASSTTSSTHRSSFASATNPNWFDTNNSQAYSISNAKIGHRRQLPPTINDNVLSRAKFGGSQPSIINYTNVPFSIDGPIEPTHMPHIPNSGLKSRNTIINNNSLSPVSPQRNNATKLNHINNTNDNQHQHHHHHHQHHHHHKKKASPMVLHYGSSQCISSSSGSSQKVTSQPSLEILTPTIILNQQRLPKQQQPIVTSDESYGLKMTRQNQQQLQEQGRNNNATRSSLLVSAKTNRKQHYHHQQQLDNSNSHEKAIRINRTNKPIILNKPINFIKPNHPYPNNMGHNSNKVEQQQQQHHHHHHHQQQQQQLLCQPIKGASRSDGSCSLNSNASQSSATTNSSIANRLTDAFSSPNSSSDPRSYHHNNQGQWRITVQQNQYPKVRPKHNIAYQDNSDQTNKHHYQYKQQVNSNIRKSTSLSSVATSLQNNELEFCHSNQINQLNKEAQQRQQELCNQQKRQQPIKSRHFTPQKQTLHKQTEDVALNQNCISSNNNRTRHGKRGGVANQILNRNNREAYKSVLPPLPRTQSLHELIQLRPTENGQNLRTTGTLRGQPSATNILLQYHFDDDDANDNNNDSLVSKHYDDINIEFDDEHQRRQSGPNKATLTRSKSQSILNNMEKNAQQRDDDELHQILHRFRKKINDNNYQQKLIGQNYIKTTEPLIVQHQSNDIDDIIGNNKNNRGDGLSHSKASTSSSSINQQQSPTSTSTSNSTFSSSGFASQGSQSELKSNSSSPSSTIANNHHCSKSNEVDQELPSPSSVSSKFSNPSLALSSSDISVNSKHKKSSSVINSVPHETDGYQDQSVNKVPIQAEQITKKSIVNHRVGKYRAPAPPLRLDIGHDTSRNYHKKSPAPSPPDNANAEKETFKSCLNRSYQFQQQLHNSRSNINVPLNSKLKLSSSLLSIVNEYNSLASDISTNSYGSQLKLTADSNTRCNEVKQTMQDDVKRQRQISQSVSSLNTIQDRQSNAVMRSLASKNLRDENHQQFRPTTNGENGSDNLSSKFKNGKLVNLFRRLSERTPTQSELDGYSTNPSICDLSNDLNNKRQHQYNSSSSLLVKSSRLILKKSTSYKSKIASHQVYSNKSSNSKELHRIACLPDSYLSKSRCECDYSTKFDCNNWHLKSGNTGQQRPLSTSSFNNSPCRNLQNMQCVQLSGEHPQAMKQGQNRLLNKFFTGSQPNLSVLDCKTPAIELTRQLIFSTASKEDKKRPPSMTSLSSLLSVVKDESKVLDEFDASYSSRDTRWHQDSLDSDDISVNKAIIAATFDADQLYCDSKKSHSETEKSLNYSNVKIVSSSSSTSVSPQHFSGHSNANIVCCSSPSTSFTYHSDKVKRFARKEPLNVVSPKVSSDDSHRFYDHHKETSDLQKNVSPRSLIHSHESVGSNSRVNVEPSLLPENEKYPNRSCSKSDSTRGLESERLNLRVARNDQNLRQRISDYTKSPQHNQLYRASRISLDLQHDKVDINCCRCNDNIINCRDLVIKSTNSISSEPLNKTEVNLVNSSPQNMVCSRDIFPSPSEKGKRFQKLHHNNFSANAHLHKGKFEDRELEFKVSNNFPKTFKVINGLNLSRLNGQIVDGRRDSEEMNLTSRENLDQAQMTEMFSKLLPRMLRSNSELGPHWNSNLKVQNNHRLSPVIKTSNCDGEYHHDDEIIRNIVKNNQSRLRPSSTSQSAMNTKAQVTSRQFDDNFILKRKVPTAGLDFEVSKNLEMNTEDNKPNIKCHRNKSTIIKSSDKPKVALNMDRQCPLHGIVGH